MEKIDPLLLQEHKAFLNHVKNLNEQLLSQIETGVIKKYDLKNLDEYNTCVEAYEKAIDDQDEIMILLERRALENEMLNLTDYILMSKLDMFSKMN